MTWNSTLDTFAAIPIIAAILSCIMIPKSTEETTLRQQKITEYSHPHSLAKPWDGATISASARLPYFVSSIVIVMPLGSATNQTGLYYLPNSTVVVSGLNVSWVNHDVVTHTATAGSSERGPTGLFDTGTIDPGGYATVIIHARPGSIVPYYCTIHPWMNARLIVAQPLKPPTQH